MLLSKVYNHVHMQKCDYVQQRCPYYYFAKALGKYAKYFPLHVHIVDFELPSGLMWEMSSMACNMCIPVTGMYVRYGHSYAITKQRLINSYLMGTIKLKLFTGIVRKSYHVKLNFPILFTQTILGFWPMVLVPCCGRCRPLFAEPQLEVNRYLTKCCRSVFAVLPRHVFLMVYKGGLCVLYTVVLLRFIDFYAMLCSRILYNIVYVNQLLQILPAAFLIRR